MKVLLLKPCWPYPVGDDFIYNRIWPPLCLANCAALLLREGHTVRIFDAHAERTPADKIKEHVYGFDKIFITSSALDRWQCPNLNIEPFLRAARLIRKENDELYVMGYHGTVNPDEILSLTGAKAIIRGQPEIGVLEICQNQSLSRIKGISYRSSGKIISTAERAVI